jgi:hypothetical protein
MPDTELDEFLNIWFSDTVLVDPDDTDEDD